MSDAFARLVAGLRRRDGQLLALRRSARTAIVVPALFAIGGHVVVNADFATFAAFGSFAMLLFTEFSGPRIERMLSTAAMGVAGAVLVALGTLASRTTWLAVIAMMVVGFVVLFSGVVSSGLASATTGLLLAFVLPVATPAPNDAIPWRIAGWLLAAAVASISVVVLWPAPPRTALRAPAMRACHALATRLRTAVAAARGDIRDPAVLEAAVSDGQSSVEALRRAFYATPYRPTGLTTSARMVVGVVDELGWLSHMLDATDPRDLLTAPRHSDPEVCAVKEAAADVLDAAAGALEEDDLASLAERQGALAHSVRALESHTATATPLVRTSAASSRGPGETDAIGGFVSSLEPRFRAQETAGAVQAVAGNAARANLADRRTWWDRVIGRQPEGVDSRLPTAWRRALGHLDAHSVWLHNSLRGAVGLGLAVLVADLFGVQHSFWVVLGTLSVLRSTALATGQNVLRGLGGTLVGVVIGGALVWLIGTNTAVLWAILPIAILLAGVAPAAISFAAGQAAFTVTLLVLFNLIAPLGWSVGLVRVEDIAIGGAVSLAVGALFWPRGAGAALGAAIAEAYRECAAYLTDAVLVAITCCDGAPGPSRPTVTSAAATAAAANRLDDAFRTYLAERGTKPMGLADVATLVTGVAGLQLAAAAVVELWVDPPPAGGDRAAVRGELAATVRSIAGWYAQLADAVATGGAVPAAQPADSTAAARLVDAVRRDLAGPDGTATALGVRIVWTGDHLDATRRLQAELAGPATAAARAVRARNDRRSLVRDRLGLRGVALGRRAEAQ